MSRNLIEEIKSKASSKKRTIVLPESHDERVLKSAEKLISEGICNVITIGNEEQIRVSASELGVNLQGVRIIDPKTSDRLSDFANIFFNKRKNKGITIDQARETMINDLFFGAMLVEEGMADGSVAGSTAATGDVLRAAFQCVGMPEGISIVSSFFLMIFPEKVYWKRQMAVLFSWMK